MLALFKQKNVKRCFILILCLGMVIPSVVVIYTKSFMICKNMVQSFFTPKNIRCNINNINNEALKEKIVTYIQQTSTQRKIIDDHNAFIHELKQSFPIISHVNCTFSIRRELLIDIEGVKPWGVINKQYVLTHTNVLLPLAMFTNAEIQKLHNLCVSPTLLNNQSLQQVTIKIIEKIPVYYWTLFSITINSPNAIELIPYKSICKCRIITDNSSVANTKKIDAINAVFSDLCKQGFVTEKTLRYNGTSLAFDVRMKDQIVVKFYKQWQGGKGL